MALLVEAENVSQDSNVSTSKWPKSVTTVNEQMDELVSFSKAHHTPEKETDKKLIDRKIKIKWFNAIVLLTLHVLAVFNFFYLFLKVKVLTIIFNYIYAITSSFGVTAGAHRLFSHRSYKAKPQLEALLVCLYSMAGLNPLFEWVRDHRVHHKHSETNADPHNANKGFFFSHVGWLCQTKNPEVLRKGSEIDMSDILSNPIIRFHQKYFWGFQIFFCFFLPSILPVLLWNEDLGYSFWLNSTVRYAFILNATWLVNSAAHIYGNRPFSKHIGPSQNSFVSFFASGEGWHNYHHVFPWDYKADELGPHSLNWTTYFINFMADIGWAYDLKQPSADLIQRVALKHGDGTYTSCHTN